ncbi:ArsR family transcriptional regulator [Streptomyces oceani]|uniref:ArsR family transcriptional regulator n=1 Tax=Streptomyces oceani TaxID=1075402 RepID=A0A1E7JF50_9ACTN|nr:ArsR family transcriptional regulator [Streptomyces oceani]OEU85097.1 ArsR family transcriptional regulator [Streptomyces oceani]
MGCWEISTDTLAGSRFVVSELAETTASLLTLERGVASHPGERDWLAAHRGAYQRRLAADPVTARLVREGYGVRWLADFLTPVPPDGGEAAGGAAGTAAGTDTTVARAPRFAEELRLVRETPPDLARQDLGAPLGGPLGRPPGGQPPAELRRDDLPSRAAALLGWVWAETVLPYWPRRARIIEADVVARTDQLVRGGWAAALDRMRPGMRWLGGGRLQINTQDNPPRTIADARLLFVPVTSAKHGWVAWDRPAPGTGKRRRYAVVYPCAGALADPERVPVPRALGALLGPVRARMLVLLDAPKSTSQLVALTGQGLGSVGGHLRVLREAGLVRRRRSGRSVLYFRTAAGDAVVRAPSDGG